MRERYDRELPPFISIVRYTGRPVVLVLEKGSDRELFFSNPHVDRPLKILQIGTLKHVNWGGEISVDFDALTADRRSQRPLLEGANLHFGG